MTDTAARVLYNASLAREGHGPVDDIEWEQVWTSYREIPESRIDKIMQDIAALTEAGIMLLTKKQAIDYVMDLPFDESGETHTWPVNPNTAGRRLRELQKAMIGAGK